MGSSIPASRIVNVTPSALKAGGTGLAINGLILTTSNRIPIGSVLPFGSADAVGAWFGLSSAEYNASLRYFAGYDNSPIKPGTLLFSQYAEAAVAAYLRGGSVAGMTIAQLQALAGVVTVRVNGANVVSAAIDLSTAVSFSAAATLITTALAGPVCVYDATYKAFVITSGTTGAASTIAPASVSAISTGLKLTAAAGATASQGSDVMVPGVAMTAIAATTQNFVSFMTLFRATPDEAFAFAGWNNDKNNRFVYVQWDNDATLGSTDDSATGFGRIRAAGYGATLPLYDPIDGAFKAAAIMGIFASIDFTKRNGRVNLALRSQNGLLAGVTDETISDNLIANGVNFYGAYATAAQGFVFFYPGEVSGDFAFADTLVNEIWLNNEFQLALMLLLTTVPNVPYNDQGKALIESAMQAPIDAAVLFGAIQAGVVLSALQKTEINNAAGANVADVITQRGWYLQVQNTAPEVRAARGSPPIQFWYADGGSVQKISLNSVEVQ